jgi:hypothetical protein
LGVVVNTPGWVAPSLKKVNFYLYSLLWAVMTYSTKKNYFLLKEAGTRKKRAINFGS